MPAQQNRSTVQFIDSGAILRPSWCGQTGAMLTPDIYDATVNPPIATCSRITASSRSRVASAIPIAK